jgi:hypothetical protein
MAMWHLTFQLGKQPISVRRADGVSEMPPTGLIRYVEIEYGAWTLDVATHPVGIEGVEWPKPCVAREATGCDGLMEYVEHVLAPVTMAQTGERKWPAGWVCRKCGCQEVYGFSVVTIEHK